MLTAPGSNNIFYGISLYNLKPFLAAMAMQASKHINKQVEWWNGGKLSVFKFINKLAMSRVSDRQTIRQKDRHGKSVTYVRLCFRWRKRAKQCFKVAVKKKQTNNQASKQINKKTNSQTKQTIEYPNRQNNQTNNQTKQ